MVDTIPTKPFDAKRAELRAKGWGWDDEQINKILMDAEAQSLAQQQQTAVGGVGTQGVMSGSISSLVAVMGYLRDTMTVSPDHVAMVFDKDVGRPNRARAATLLISKLMIIGVIGLAV